MEVERKNLPKNIEILASTKNTIMALKVKKYNIYGIQFHPESIASEFGHILFKNFLDLCEKEINCISNILYKLSNNQNLTSKEATFAFRQIITGKISEIQSAGLLMAL